MEELGVRVDIDLAADALSIGWAERGPGKSQTVGRPGRQGARIHYNDSGDVVGLEILGWSRRTADTTEVAVSIHAANSAEALGEDDALVGALAAASVETDRQNRPMQNGKPMITLAEAALLIGKERSWLSREMTANRLLGLKIGRSWWTTRGWIDVYLEAQMPRKNRSSRTG